MQLMKGGSIMAVPSWFDEYTYLQSKLNQLISAGQTQYSNVTQVKAAIEAAGMSVCQHFEKFSLAERTSPNTYFNTQEYLEAKAAQLNTAQGVTTWTADKVALEFQNAGFTNAYEHFSKYGWAEGVNPSNSFDVSSYLEAKAKAAGKTVDEVKAAFEAAGLDPIAHYETYGKSEGITVTEVPADEQVTPDSSGSTGQTFMLTKGVDLITGTSGNDTFIAGDDGGTASLNAGDVINGGAGTDTLKIFNSATVTNGANFTTASISGVENVEFTSAATNQALDVSGNADVTKVTLVNGLDAVVTAKLTQTVGLKGNINTSTAATSFVFTSVAGAADSANVVLDGASTAAGTADNGLTLQDVETLNLALTGTNVVGKFDSDATKLVITGAGTLKTTLTETGGSASLVKTIDASAATGALDIDNSSFAGALETITLGSGNDRYVSLFAKKDALDKIDLGAGTNDILAFADATDLSTTTKAAVLAGAKNYEAIEVTGTDAFTVDGDALGSSVTKYIADTTGAFTGTNIYSGTTLEVGDVALDASTVGMKLGEKVLNVTLAGSKTAISDASAGLTVTGATDVKVASNGFADQTANKLDLTSDDNTTVTITGAQGLVLTTTAATGTTGFTIDGSAATGALDLTGTVAADIIKGGSGNDTINLANGDTATGNGGADKFIVDITPAGTAAADFTAVMASITDFATGTDTIKLSATAATSANFTKATAAVADFTAALAAADTALNGTVVYNVQFVGNDAYVFFDADGTIATDTEADGTIATDTEVVKLVGVGLTGFAMTDIVAA
jgi:uncharacterized protein YdeI (BOF family)